MYPEISKEVYFLPKRSRRNVGKLNNCQPNSFVTNFYSVKMHSSFTQIFLYEVKFPSDIPSDSTQIFNRCLFQLRTEMKEAIGFICFSGKTVYGSKESKLPLVFKSKIGQNVIQLQLKVVKKLALTQLLKDPKTRPLIFHFLNSKLKSCLRAANICQLGKQGQFFPKDQLLNSVKKQMQRQYQDLELAGMNVLRGYKFTLVMMNSQLKLQLDVCSRVLQKNNLLEDFQDFVGSNQQLKAYYKGAVIITRYGNYKTYKIDEIDFKLSPSSTFQMRGQKISFQKYFKKAYNADIYDLKQPLIRVLAKDKRQMTKTQKIQTFTQYIYLVPELVSSTGMKDQQRANFQCMKALAPFTKLNPSDRFYQSCKVLDTLAQAKDILQIGGYQQMNGYQLSQPKVRFKELANIRSGAIANRGQLFKPHKFSTWMFVYCKFNQQDFNEAVSAQNYLKQAGVAYGIQFQQPIYVQILANNKTNPLQICDQIKHCVKRETKKIQLIFLILKNKEPYFYGAIKHVLTNQIGIPCQVVLSKTLNKGKGILSIASKIAIQMSCKAGDAPWIVDNPIPYFKNRNFAYSAISSSKSKGGFAISFVGTINNSCSKVYSNYILRVQKKQRIDGVHLNKWFIGWIKAYFMKNNGLPDTLIIYRESVGDSLLTPVLEHQIHNLKQSIQVVKKKTKSPNYNPEIIYIFVNKRVNSRFYQANRNQLQNPEPGSIVVEEMSTDDRFDFHLVAQKVNQGSSTPTHYIVAYDSSNIPQQDLFRFTYDQCYNYYNWQGSVKVPSCLQCSNKLSKLAGQAIQQPLVESKAGVNETYFFL